MTNITNQEQSLRNVLAKMWINAVVGNSVNMPLWEWGSLRNFRGFVLDKNVNLKLDKMGVKCKV